MKVIATVVALVLLVLIALPWSRSYLRQSHKDADNAFRDRVRNEQVIAEAVNDINKAKAYLTDQYTKVVEGKEKLATQEATLDSKNRKLAREKEIFLKASGWVEAHQPTDTVQLNGRAYSYADVRKDASNRANEVKNLNTEIEALRQACQMLSQAVSDSENNIKLAMRKINEREGKLKAQEIQLQAWDAIRATQAICKDIAFTGNTPFDTRHIDEVDRRVAQMKAGMEVSSWATTTSGSVPWDEGNQDQGELDNIRSTKNMLTGTAPKAESTSPAEALSALPEPAIKDVPAKTPATVPAITPAR